MSEAALIPLEGNTEAPSEASASSAPTGSAAAEQLSPEPSHPSESEQRVHKFGPSAIGLLRAALLPESNVDFPLITEICERLESEPSEISKTVTLLVAVLNGKANYRTKLKALTISNEMLYDERVITAFRSHSGVPDALAALKTVRNTGLGDPIDENIRMLATEMSKIILDPGQIAGIDPKARKGRSFGLAMRSNLGRLEKTVNEKLQRFDRSLQTPEMQSTMHDVEKKLARTGEKFENATTAFFKASSSMMSRLRSDGGSSPSTSPNASPGRGGSSKIWSGSSNPSTSEHAIQAQQQLQTSGKHVSSAASARIEAAGTLARQQLQQYDREKSQLRQTEEDRPRRKSREELEDEALNMAIAASLSASSSHTVDSPAARAQARESRRIEDSVRAESGRMGDSESLKDSKEQSGPNESASDPTSELQQRVEKAEQALADVHQRAAACRSQTRQLRGELTDSRSAMIHLSEALTEAEEDHTKATARLAELQLGFADAHRQMEACGAAKVH